MANCKAFNVRGTLPFNYTDSRNFCSTMAFIQSPNSGFVIEFEPAGTVPNADGSNGRTFMFDFHLTGTEAVSWDWADHFEKSVKEVGGSILTGVASDLESGADEKKYFKPSD